MSNRSADLGEMKHAEDCMVLNRLILDLKKQKLGIDDGEPITMERLNECSKALHNIQQCRIKRFYK